MDSPSSALACIGIVLFPDVARTHILLQVNQTTAVQLNKTSTHLENIVDHVLAEFGVDGLGLFLVRSLVDSIGLVTNVGLWTFHSADTLTSWRACNAR
jgi:hypothetical protein